METTKVMNVKSLKELRKFNLEFLDTDKFIKVNECKEITNPIYFSKPGVPTSDGLLSNEIFGTTKEERAGTYAYISLGEYFMHPLIYKIWSRRDSRIRECVHGTKKFIIDEEGNLVEDANGECGIDFLRKNFDRIKMKESTSHRTKFQNKFIQANKKSAFIKNYLVIPAFYRDKDTSNNSKITVTNSNSLYQSLIIATNSLRESLDYGLEFSNGARGRIQEILLKIYDWFCKEPNLSKKMGIIKRAGMSKTTDYASRVVISAPELKVESWKDLMVDLDYAAVPLESVCSNFLPFMIFAVRRFFENEFMSGDLYHYYDKSGQLKTVHVKDPLIEFSDERIKQEIERYIKGFANRLIPIEVPNEEGITLHMKFKGKISSSGKEFTEDQLQNRESLEQSDKLGIVDRDLTWCDVLYICACEVVKNKTILVTRYPFDSYYSQFPVQVRVSCMKRTETVVLDGEVYPYYPLIRQEYIGKNTSNMFISTLNISNLYLSAIGGDYDGDQVTIKGLYYDESNKEQLDLINSKSHYLTLNGINVRVTTNEGIQALYNLTKKLPGTKITKPKFKTQPMYKV